MLWVILAVVATVAVFACVAYMWTGGVAANNRASVSYGRALAAGMQRAGGNGDEPAARPDPDNAAARPR